MNMQREPSNDSDLGARLVKLSLHRGRVTYACIAAFLTTCLLLLLHTTGSVPSTKQYFAHEQTVSAAYPMYQLNYTKVATIIEPRNIPVLLPILHNFLSSLPQDWPIVVWCSDENFVVLEKTRTLDPYLRSGKLSLRMLPWEYAHMDGVSVSRFMAHPWFWTQFGDAEYVLVFQSDSILCSRSDGSIDDWVGYDFVGHPLEWALQGRGGNGGLSMRRISSMLRMATQYHERLQEANAQPEYLDFEKWRHLSIEDRSLLYTAEDAFFVYNLAHEDDTLKENSTIRWPVQDGRSQARFAFDIWLSEGRSIEDVKPLALHTGDGGGIARLLLNYDGTEYNDKAKSWIRYCPELAYLRFVP